MNIGIDIDDTSVEFMRPFLEWHNRVYGTYFVKAQMKVYEFWEIMNITKEEAFDRTMRFYHSDEHKNSPVTEGAKETIAELAKIGRVYAITSRPTSASSVTAKLIDENFGRDIEGICILNHWGSKEATQTKAQMCKKLDIGVLVDDSPGHISECVRRGIRPFLFTQPWNESFSISDNIRRVERLGEVLRYLKIPN